MVAFLVVHVPKKESRSVLLWIEDQCPVVRRNGDLMISFGESRFPFPHGGFHFGTIRKRGFASILREFKQGLQHIGIVTRGLSFKRKFSRLDDLLFPGGGICKRRRMSERRETQSLQNSCIVGLFFMQFFKQGE